MKPLLISDDNKYWYLNVGGTGMIADKNVAGLNDQQDMTLSLYQLLNPAVRANPYPLYQRLRCEAPVYWDHYLHAWVVTRYEDVLHVFQHFSADRTPTPAQLMSLGLSSLAPLAQTLIRLMLFMDPPDHGRVRGLASRAFTPRRVEMLRTHIAAITNDLLDAVQGRGQMDVIADLAYPLPAIVTAGMLGVPTSDWQLLTRWSADFAQVLGGFQHSPEQAPHVIRTLEDMTAYFREALQDHRKHPRDGLISAFLAAEMDGDRLTEEEIIANTIVTMVGGQETTTNLIGNGILTLLHHRDQFEQLRTDLALIPSAIEELLRYESPIQHTARLAPEDVELGGQLIRKRQAVIAVMGAANRDPERFPDPDRFDIHRQDNRHVAFAWASHFCFGAPLARLEGKIVFEAMLRRMPELQLEHGPLTWRENLGFRGLTALPVRF
jgi:cytochrome P450